MKYEDIITTEERRQAFKQVLKALGKGRRPKFVVCKHLYGGEDKPYKNSGAAADFLKDLVKSELPVESKGDKLYRTDIKPVNS